MKEIVNLTSRALPLEDGTILAARGTDGCVKQVESLSDGDARRLGDRVFVREVNGKGQSAKSKESDSSPKEKQ